MTTVIVVHNELLEEGVGDSSILLGYVETSAWLWRGRSQGEKSGHPMHGSHRESSLVRVHGGLDYFKDCWTPETIEPLGSWKILREKPQLESKKQQSDLEWFARAGHELSRFKGKYVAIYDKRVVGSGKTSKDAANEAKKAGDGERVIIAFVPESEDSAL